MRRPVGSGSAFSAGFTRDLAEVWAEKGKASMLYTAEKQPAVFFATCARLIGPEVKLTIEQQQQGNLSPADWNLMLEIVDAVRQAIPDASNRAPGAVPEHVLGALRMADAKCVEKCPFYSEQMAQNIATLQAVEGNQKEDVIPAFGPTISDQPR